MQRGPLVYALEQIDQAGLALTRSVYQAGRADHREPRRDLLGGVSVLKISGQAAERSISEEPLYQPLAAATNRAKRSVTLTFIPYYAIGNREPTPMEVWVPALKDALGVRKRTSDDRKTRGRPVTSHAKDRHERYGKIK